MNSGIRKIAVSPHPLHPRTNTQCELAEEVQQKLKTKLDLHHICCVKKLSSAIIIIIITASLGYVGYFI